eukprot:SAG31_NODE_29514_length_394_cov_0.688136_1_plen_78_part_01
MESRCKFHYFQTIGHGMIDDKPGCTARVHHQLECRVVPPTWPNLGYIREMIAWTRSHVGIYAKNERRCLYLLNCIGR